jgi:hypothetical protein
MTIKKIKTRIRLSGDVGLFHNSRHDILALSKVCNELIDKVNELTDKVNELEKRSGEKTHTLR